MKKKIYFIYMPSTTLGRAPLQGTGGGLFAYYREDKYITSLNSYFDINAFDWVAKRDDTESDIELLIKQGAVLLICAPGLRFQFYRNGFSKENVIYLSTMEYINNDVKPVIKRIKEIENEK
ncbi:nitrogen fixation protein NifS [Salmonella enterica]|nr:nitrogen fixation protein NifS [Salmonella enterica]EBL5541394.1 nitrogen fixation protein NifS [Salmonella enterica subsp. enterica serovar Newport]EDQ2836994.1 nitrogen fixation protein NifS [Salmonella enterica subsp. enterica]EEN6707739.1 nitrogen fixation protein NifS [Salmonella enterica subsp. enterica serovar Rubislaw]EGI5590877.1 nitrogen fixation protein NifS [Salmonella enterica subsp. enterica serovar Butantan]